MARSVMDHTFSEVPRASIPRSQFDRSHVHKTSMDADYLVPVLVDDIIPGDSFNVGVSVFARLATPLFPIMDNLFFEWFAFFTPYRLLWSNWEKFMGAQDNPGDSIDFTIPACSASTTADLTTGSLQAELLRYMGMPYNASVNLTQVSALPSRAYNLIYNEWFRDQNLQNSVTVDLDNGPDDEADYVLKKRGKRHDYFTSCLPTPQKGSAVSLPLGTSADVHALSTGANDTYGVYDDNDAAQRLLLPVTNTSVIAGATAGDAKLYADLSEATAATINDLRLAVQTQRLLERDARSGTRYRETLLAHWGVTVPDFRLQRPEFLGGGSHRINITPVAQTTYQGTPTDEDTKGSLAGFGTVSGTDGFSKSFVEHGCLTVLANIRGDITYSQGIERYWRKTTRLDFYYPVLSQIGEMAVLNGEIFYQNAAADDQVFGYQGVYDEYRYKPSRLSGKMPPDHATSLAAWHVSEDFSALPTLGDSFIQSNTGTPLDRAIAVSSEPHFICDIAFRMICARPMPLYGVPGNLDRF